MTPMQSVSPYKPMNWERVRRMSPYFNTCTIEARLRGKPNRSFFRTRNNEPITQGIFEFRCIRKSAKTNWWVWEDVAYMKVLGWGIQGEILYRSEKGDLLRVEGYLSSGKLVGTLKRPTIPRVVVLLAKSVIRLIQWPESRYVPPRDATTNRFIGVKVARQIEQEKLAKKNLIKQREDAKRFLPDDVPEVPEGLDFSIE